MDAKTLCKSDLHSQNSCLKISDSHASSPTQILWVLEHKTRTLKKKKSLEMHTKFIKGCASDKYNITLPPDP